ncbi:MAG: 3-deoxy-manno-octulosonate cytidylyltransferase [Neisseriaceae bacterium]
MKRFHDFFVIIPARLESTRLPRKVLLELSGLPMLIHVAKRCQQSQAREVWVATDSSEIMATCQRHNIPVIMTQTHHQSGTDRLAEAVQKLKFEPEQIIVNVQADEPLIEPNLIDQLVRDFSQSTSPVGTLAYPLLDKEDFDNPNLVKVVLSKLSTALYFSRAPIPFEAYSLPSLSALGHMGVYAYRAKFLYEYSRLGPTSIEQAERLEQLRILWHGYTIHVSCVSPPKGKGIDTQKDFEEILKIFDTNTNKEL